MQVVPVMDLMHGQVVRGVGGRRDEYRPIQSLLCDDSLPRSVAQAFAKLGFRQVYVADLDAIEKGVRTVFSRPDDSAHPCSALYTELLQSGLELWIDAGLKNADEARDLARLEFQGRRITGIVAGLESLDNPNTLAAMCRAVGPERLVFSLDMKRGTPLVGSPAWHGLSAEQIAAIALRVGVRRMIVLDLAAVGMGEGVGTEPFCRALRCMAPDLQIIAGGGVRGPGDLESLARAGCDAALVASALHDGRLTADECVAR